MGAQISNHSHRKSFGGGKIGLMSNEEHSYKVSKGNESLQSVADEINKKLYHSRAHSMKSSNYLMTNHDEEDRKQDDKHKYIIEIETEHHEHAIMLKSPSDDDDQKEESDEDNQHITVGDNKHYKTQTFLMINSDADKM